MVGGPIEPLVPVKRIEITSIEAKRFSKSTEKAVQVRIDHNSTVTLIQETAPTHATIEFRYTANYGAMGLIKLEGTIAFEGDAKGITAQWNTTSQRPHDVANEIHNTVMRVCIPEAVGLAKDLNLPPPIPLPQVNTTAQGGKAPGAPTWTGGPEVV